MKQEKTLNETIETAVYDYLNEKFHNFVFHVHFSHTENILKQMFQMSRAILSCFVRIREQKSLRQNTMQSLVKFVFLLNMKMRNIQLGLCLIV